MNKRILGIFILVFCLSMAPGSAKEISGFWEVRASHDATIIEGLPNTNSGWFPFNEVESTSCTSGPSLALFKFDAVNQIGSTPNGGIISSMEGKIPFFAQVIMTSFSLGLDCHISRDDCAFESVLFGPTDWKENTVTWNNFFTRVNENTKWQHRGNNTHNFTCNALVNGSLFPTNLSGAGQPFFEEVKSGIALNNIDLMIRNSEGHKDVGEIKLHSEESGTENAFPDLVIGWFFNDSLEYYFDNNSIGQVVGTNFPLSAFINEEENFTVTVLNRGNESYTFKIGLSVGTRETGFCDVGCYGSDPSGSVTGVGPQNETWFGLQTIGPGEWRTFFNPFTFHEAFFKQGGTYDILVTIRPENSTFLINNYYVTEGLQIHNTTIMPEIVRPHSLYFDITRTSSLANYNTTSLFHPVYCTVNFTTENRIFITQADEYEAEQFRCGFFGFANNQNVSFHISSDGYVSVNNTVEYINEISTFGVTLVQDTSVCTQFGQFTTQTACESEAFSGGFNYTLSDSWNCIFDPTVCTVHQSNGQPNCGPENADEGFYSPWGAWIFFACTGGARPEGLIANQSYDSRGIVVTNGTSRIEDTGEGARPFAEAVAEGIGTDTTTAFSFISIILTMFATGAFTFVTKSKDIGIITFFGCLLTFTIIGWFPWWIFAIFTILSGFILSKTIRELAGG